MRPLSRKARCLAVSGRSKKNSGGRMPGVQHDFRRAREAPVQQVHHQKGEGEAATRRRARYRTSRQSVIPFVRSLQWYDSDQGFLTKSFCACGVAKKRLHWSVNAFVRRLIRFPDRVASTRFGLLPVSSSGRQVTLRPL